MLGRVLYLVPDLCGPPGGIARHAHVVCRALSDSNVEVTALALHDADPSAIPPTTIRYRACRGSRVRFTLEALLAARSRPDVVLVQHPHLSTLGLAAARTAGSPVVVFAHGTDIWEPLEPLRRHALQMADMILCVSQFTANRAVRENGLDPGKTRVLYHCVDPSLHPRGNSTSSEDPLSLLTVARIRTAEQYKGHDMVIRALPSLLRSFPSLRYDIVGDGDGRPALHQLARREGVEEAVHFHGEVSDERLMSLYSRATVYVMPSTGEGFGLAFIEAMAHGKPAIAGNRDASVEVVRHEETGLVIDPSDDDAFIGSVTRLLADPDLRRAMGARAAHVASTDFGFPAFRERLIDHLDSAIRGHAHRRRRRISLLPHQ